MRHILKTNSLLWNYLTQTLYQIHRTFILHIAIINLICQYFVKYFLVYPTHKHFTSRADFINDTAKCPEVWIKSTLVLLQHFWSDVERRSHKCVLSLSLWNESVEERLLLALESRIWRLQVFVCVDDFGLSEIDDFEILVILNHDIVRFEISVGYVLCL